MGVAKWLSESYRQFGSDNGQKVYRRGVETGKFRPEQISLRELAQVQFGEDWHGGMHRYRESRGWMREAIDPVTPDIFSAIVSNMIEDRIQEKYTLATQITDQLVDVTTNPDGNLGPYREEVPGTITEAAAQVLPGMPYPVTGLTTAYADVPEPVKNGLMVYVAEETVYANKTGSVLAMCDDVAEYLGRWVEKERLKVIYGITNNYSFNGTTYNTYLTSGAWINANNSLDVIDDVTADTALKLFDGMRHPLRSDEPIEVVPNAILHHRAKKITIQNTFFPDNINTTTSSGVNVDRPTTAPQLTAYTTPYQEILLAAAGLNATEREKTLVIGDFKKAFGWREVYGLQTFKANASATDLTPSGPLGVRDIVFATKSRVYGKAYVKNPRYVVKVRSSS